MNRREPLISLEDDRLNLGPLAKHLGASLASVEPESGFIFGVEGQWGSGKTSLLNMAFEHLGEMKKAPIVRVTINPWAIPPGTDLVAFFLSEFARQLKEFDAEVGGLSGGAISELSSAADSIGGFASRLAPLGKLAKVAGEAGLPFATLLSTAIDGASQLSNDESFAAGKKKIERALKRLIGKVYVVIDDLDRVEPDRVAEVLMTVRAIADFPNVVYILLYERESIGRALGRSLGVEDGMSFLEKIVQFEISMPEPESFTLRRLFRERLSKRIKDLEIEIPQSHKTNLGLVIEQWGARYLTNARRVEQVVDRVAFLVSNKDAELYLPDAVLISLIRVGNMKLYKWVEEYLTAFSSIKISGAMLASDNRRKMAKRFRDLIVEEGLDVTYEQIVIDDYLPGISASYSNEKFEEGFFNKNAEIPQAGFLHRIGSPDHYRLYFSGAFATDAPTDQYLAEVQESLSSTRKFSRLLTAATSVQDVKLLEAALNRIWRNVRGGTVQAAGEIPFRVFSELADQVAGKGSYDSLFNEATFLTEARYFVEHVKPKNLTPRKIGKIFRTAAAIEWIVGVARAEIFSHGLFGNQSEHSSRWILSPDQLDAALQALDLRFRGMSFTDFVQIPKFNHALYAWVQSGYGDNAREFVRKKTRSNSAFLKFLDAFDTGGTADRRVIRADGCGDIFDYDGFLNRLERLSKDQKFKDDAVRILSKFE